jgi:hypothetical protein
VVLDERLMAVVPKWRTKAPNLNPLVASTASTFLRSYVLARLIQSIADLRARSSTAPAPVAVKMCEFGFHRLAIYTAKWMPLVRPPRPDSQSDRAKLSAFANDTVPDKQR